MVDGGRRLSQVRAPAFRDLSGAGVGIDRGRQHDRSRWGSPANWIAVSRWRQSGTLSATITAGNQYTITFPTAFPNALVSYAITPINLTGVATRDNWLQRVSLARTGITFVVQGSVTGGDNTLDGVDWWAEGQ